MSKNKKVVSLSIDPALHDSLVELKKKRGEPVSKIISDLVEKYVHIMNESTGNGEKNVLFSVINLPNDLKGENEKSEWIAKRKKSVDNLIESLNNENEIPIVFKVPASLMGNSQEIKNWLQEKSEAVGNYLGK